MRRSKIYKFLLASVIIILLIGVGFVSAIFCVRNNKNIQEFYEWCDQCRDNLLMYEDSIRRLKYTKDVAEEIKNNNLICYSSDYITHFDEVLFSRYNIVCESLTKEMLPYYKPIMDSLIFRKFGYNIYDTVNSIVKTKYNDLPSNIDIDGFYKDTEIPPKYPGGEDALSKYKSRRTGEWNETNLYRIVTVLVSFDTTGKVIDAKLYKGFSPIYNEKSIELAKNMPDWSPAIEHGKKVKFRKYIKFYW